MKLIYMDKTIVYISQVNPDLLKEISGKGFKEVKQETTTYFKINQDE